MSESSLISLRTAESCVLRTVLANCSLEASFW